MTKRVAWFTGEATSGSVTPHKAYDVFNEDENSFNLKDDSGATQLCLKKGCAHICQADWAFADVVESVEQEVVAKPKKPKKWGSWIKNKTGECPVGLKRKQKVKLKWSDGDEFVIDNPQDAAWYFSSGNNPVDITHYKVKLKDLEKVSKPPKNPKSKWSEWIEHTTGNIPKHLAKDDIVKVKLRGLPKGKPFVVDTGCWVECGEYTIMKYKVKLT